ncbi:MULTISPECIES: acyl transferase [unclassified Nocardia]|uniref:acyl transferase n=1 Tax=unclassified Nocardia TaxID=2637762 RepID=UPI001CE48B60|nr:MULTISPECIES: acyl transferase [unclassified Nocardia]
MRICTRTTAPLSWRSTVTALGVLACAAAIGGCSSAQTTIRPPSTTVVTSSAPSNTVTTQESAQPPTVIPQSPTAAPQPPAPETPPQPAPNPHPSSGTSFPGEGLTPQQAADLQKSVDSGHQPWRLDRVAVAKAFVQGRFGWFDVQTSTGAPVVVFVTNRDGSRVALHLIQPATHGDHGIWEVDSGVWS